MTRTQALRMAKANRAKKINAAGIHIHRVPRPLDFTPDPPRWRR